MADGTPLDALETGEIPNQADSAKMVEIMRDINASGNESAEMPPTMHISQQMPPPQMIQHAYAPPPAHLQQQYYTPVQEEEYKPRKKNMWSNLTAKLRDPLFVTILFFVLSLPILHTQLAKYAGWAFAVGGQFNYVGLLALSLVGGISFGLFQSIADIAGF